MKRVLFLSDLHCGHGLGLTPPEYQTDFFREVQYKGWEFYSKYVNELKPDIVLVNGDAVDGVLLKDNSDMITTNSARQQEIAIRCLDEVPKKSLNNEDVKFLFTRGTPVHVKSDTELEDDIAKYFNAEIYDFVKFRVNDLIISARHTAGKGGTVYSSVTGLQRSAIVQYLNDSIKGEETADLYVRSHIHDYNYLDRALLSILSTPCLQFSGTAFGRKCLGFYDYGVSWADIEDKYNYQVYKKLLTHSSGKEHGIIEL